MVGGEVVEAVRRVLERHGEVLLGVVFGSVLRGGVFRDVDVAVYVEGDWLGVVARVGAELERALGVDVDVVALNEAPPRFALRVLREGVVVVDRGGLRHALLHVYESELEDLEAKPVSGPVAPILWPLPTA